MVGAEKLEPEPPESWQDQQEPRPPEEHKSFKNNKSYRAGAGMSSSVWRSQSKMRLKLKRIWLEVVEMIKIF
jgi:hypothetical protein